MTRRAGALTLVCGLLTLWLASEARAECPTSTLCGGQSTAPAAYCQTWDGYGYATYNHVQGSLASDCSAPHGGSSSDLYSVDSFTMTGSSPATCIASLRLSVDQNSRTSPTHSWAVISSSGSSARADFSGIAARDTTLRLALALVPGEPVTLTCEAHTHTAEASCYASLSGVLRFDLLPGYSIQSCGGYAVPVTAGVPVRPLHTWGSLRRSYR